MLCLIACTPKSDSIYKAPINKNDGLTVSTLSQHHLDLNAFDKVNKDILNKKYGNIHSVLVIHKNELVVEQYYNGWKSNDLHFMASTTKCMSAILTGIAIEQGKIENTQQKMLDFFSGVCCV